MRFLCKTEKDEWNGNIRNIKLQNNVYEFWIESKSSIMVVFGSTSRGGFACFPDFQVRCHLVSLKDKFWNTKKLVEILGKVDGTTVAAALTKLAENSGIKTI